MTPPDGAVQGAIHIADCLAHAVRWEGVFGCNLLIGFVCFDPVEPGEGVGDIAQERAVDGFRGVAQNELGLDAASTQAERCVDAECILANAVRSHREASSERIAVEQDGHRAGADVDPPDKTEQGGCEALSLTLIAKRREECSAGVLTKEPLGLCLEH